MADLLRPLAVVALCVPLCSWALDDDCFHTAARRFRLDEDLLLTIAKVESNFQPRAIHYNTDGSYDLGVMQINSRHVAGLESQHISVDTLLNRPCTNVQVGALILSGFIRQYGPTWRAVGAYGAGTRADREAARRTYAARVAQQLERVRRSLAADRRMGRGAVAASTPVRMLVVD